MKVLVFKLGNEEYGINVQEVQEIWSYERITSIPNAPFYVKGVINLRGNIVPIIDLRIRFGLDQLSYNHLTVVVVISVGTCVIGMVVDSVADVTRFIEDQVKPVPNLGTALTADYLIGVASVDERMVLLLDVEKILSGSELGVIERLAAQYLLVVLRMSAHHHWKKTICLRI